MGLFDSLTEGLKGVLGQVTVQDLPGMLNAALAQTPMGNLQGLADQLQSGGLGAEVQSWIGAGKNLPISADQLKEVLGSDQVKQIAQHFGIDPEAALKLLEQNLPATIDAASPNGVLPASH